MTNTAPIALFAFNRPEHLQATLDALRNNELASETRLTVFCDGARNEEDIAGVERVREIAHKTDGFEHVTVVEQERNLGLAESVISGVRSILDRHEAVIVLEDDLVTAPGFLRFMNDALDRYADDERVISVCGYSYPVRGRLPDTYFLLGAHCWGWATWRRAWALFSEDPLPLVATLEQNDDLLYEFDRAGSYPHTQFLQRAACGEADSWALRWMASAVVNDKLTLYPGRSLVSNIGMDSSGTNAPTIDVYSTALAEQSPRVGEAAVRQDPDARRLLREFHIRWRRTWSVKFRLYYTLAPLLPERFEKKVYAAIVRRALRRIRAHEPSPSLSTGAA